MLPFYISQISDEKIINFGHRYLRLVPKRGPVPEVGTWDHADPEIPASLLNEHLGLVGCEDIGCEMLSKNFKIRIRM